MQGKLLLWAALVFLSKPSFSQYYFQYFEGADTAVSNSVFVELDPDTTNIWQIGVPNKIIFDQAATFPNALVTDTINYYPVNNTSRFSIWHEPYPWMWGIYALQWKQKIDFDAGTDGGLVEFSGDGITWHNAFNNPYVYNFYGFNPINQDTLATGEYAFSGTDTLWRDVWLCFDFSWLGITPSDTIRVRFTLKSDSVNNNREGWLIDNFMAHMTFVHTAKGGTQKEYMKVYPTTTNRLLHIETEKIEAFHIIETIELVNANGQVVEQWQNCPTRFFIDISKHQNGSYFLRVKTNIRTETFPVFLQKN